MFLKNTVSIATVVSEETVPLKYVHTVYTDILIKDSLK